jgi:aspartate/tyrosine/aromatic aminotransferase
MRQSRFAAVAKIMATFFGSVPEAPADGIFEIRVRSSILHASLVVDLLKWGLWQTLYNQEKDPNKIDVGVGAYRDDSGKPTVMKAVQKVRYMSSSKQLLLDFAPGMCMPLIVLQAERLCLEEAHNFEYLPVEGLQSFRE